MVTQKATSFTLDIDTLDKLNEIAKSARTSNSGAFRKLVKYAPEDLPDRVIFVGEVSGQKGAYGDVWQGEYTGIVRVHLLNKQEGPINPLMADVELKGATLKQIIENFC